MKQKQNPQNGKQQQLTTWVLCLSLVFTAAVWSGCKQEPKVAADTPVVGTYRLVSLDGHKVPCTIEHEGHTVTVKSGTFIISPDGACSSKLAFSMPSGADSSREVKATYTQQGSKLTMQWEGAGMTIGTVENDSFTMNNEGMIFAYRK